MPNELFPGRPCDGTVGDLITQWDYIDGKRAVRYLEPGRGLCTAYRDSYGRYRIRLGGVGIQERPITDDVKSQPAWWVDHDGNGGEALPPLRYFKVKDSNGVVHFRAFVATTQHVLLCGLPDNTDVPYELVKHEVNVNCMGCVAREGLLTLNPKDITWLEYGGWDGPYP